MNGKIIEEFFHVQEKKTCKSNNLFSGEVTFTSSMTKTSLALNTIMRTSLIISLVL